MQFLIYIAHNRKQYRLKVEVLLLTHTIEQYRVYNSKTSIILQSNRPMFRNKGLKYRKPNWKVIEGSYSNPEILEKIIVELMNKIESTRK